MESFEREQIVKVLDKITRDDFASFLSTPQGEELSVQFQSVRNTLRICRLSPEGAPAKPINELIDVFGYRLLSDGALNPWLRESILRTLAASKWKKLVREHQLLGRDWHGNLTQHRKGSAVLAEHWRQGGRWARIFCRVAALPELLVGTSDHQFNSDEDIIPAEPLPKLHDFQTTVYRQLRRLLEDGRGQTALLSLPTGAGKTRVAVDAICDHLADVAIAGGPRNLVIWIARGTELLEQAWECFRQAWQVAPDRDGDRIARRYPLRLIRLWGGRDPNHIIIGDQPAIFLASAQQLNSWVRQDSSLVTEFPRRRLACVLIDEAHSTITNEFRAVLLAFGLRAKRKWTVRKEAAPVFGLTATPWRSDDNESARLRDYFSHNLLTPQILGVRPIASLQQRRILANITCERLGIPLTTIMSDSEQIKFDQFNELPSEYLVRLGLDAKRNAHIVSCLHALPQKRNRILVFACSISHAEILALALNRACGSHVAAVVTNRTPRAERSALTEAFRRGAGPRFLCNVDVLAMGFDAPLVNVVCIARPTTSALRYEQMVGRGLRGPLNGGTDDCLVFDVQDEGLPSGIMSYARVADMWDLRSAD